MASVTLTVTDEPSAGRVRIELEGDRDYRALPEPERTHAEQCAEHIYSELAWLAERIPDRLRAEAKEPEHE
ncbi:hypothetical protein [Sediminicurvatus halobius]|uniref:Uncharacterized protein n=1 Tax=Sediminicurvatus halobius TaxID=2182432 RepID=A0A2U2N138_9GAMM|nr:hypothetical protein [Spiribacter halobius]PWG62830.1 hypothetical protein DEM34_10715 [Spiribacter halobius]UEX77020.1 hypothetical protein LMH63_13840 [Spiribacter halobius]